MEIHESNKVLSIEFENVMFGRLFKYKDNYYLKHDVMMSTNSADTTFYNAINLKTGICTSFELTDIVIPLKQICALEVETYSENEPYRG